MPAHREETGDVVDAIKDALDGEPCVSWNGIALFYAVPPFVLLAACDEIVSLRQQVEKFEVSP
jgi:hypothetical protein